MNDRVDVAVIGAGPAGMEAALTAAGTGSRVALIDTYARPGGQYFKQLAGPFQVEDHTRHQRDALETFERLRAGKIQVLSDTVVWGVQRETADSPWILSLYGPQTPSRLAAGILVLATGAYDRPIAFPGWTLPGVLTAGAVQTLLKNQRVLPGRRFVLSGTGPLQLAVASQLIHAGAQVVAVLEGATFQLGWARYAGALWGQGRRLAEGLEYATMLRRAGVPIRFGHAVVAALGQDEVAEVVVARLDKAWRPVPGSQQRLQADTLVLGYGFLPSTELSRLLGCRQEYAPDQAAFVPWRNEAMETSVAGVYAVGDGTGVGGAELATIEGRIAGYSAARRLGRLTSSQADQAIAAQRPALKREQHFACLLNSLFVPGPGLYTLASDETIVCRCEEVTLGEIRQAIAGGYSSPALIKRMTRAGMGSCQGRICAQLVAAALAGQTGQDLGEIVPDGVRPPIRPVPLTALIEKAEP